MLNTTIFCDELLRGFGTDSGHAGHVVGGITHQPEHVDHLLDLLDLPLVEDLDHAENLGLVAAATGLVDQRVVGDQLAVVLVGGDHIGAKTRRLGLFGEGANDVVGLPARRANHRNIKGLAQRKHIGQRLAQILGHLLSLGLVFFVELVPVRRLGRIENCGDMRGLAPFGDRQQGVGEGEYRRGVHTAGGEPRVADQGEMAAIGQRHAVEQKENFLV